MKQYFFERIIQWTLLGITIIYILTGLGITEFRIIEPATFGLLNKNLSFVIHDNLLIPFGILLILHIAAKPIRKIYRKRKPKEQVA